MKKYWKEILVLVLQMVAFYILPLFAGPTDAMGLVLLIIMATFVLSVILGAISANKIKLLYPLAIAVFFIPSVFIYYNESALIHSVWYLVISTIGLGISSLIRWLAVRK